MFSYVDLVRAEIALEAGGHFGITITDEETDRRQTLGDIARLVAGRANVTETQVLTWLRAFMTEYYGVSIELAPEDDAFGDYDRATAWFLATKRGERFKGPDESSPG